MTKGLKIKKPLILLSLIIAILIIVFCIIPSIKFIGHKSVHNDAKTYQTLSCKIYYPNSAYGKKIAKSICDNDDSGNVYDYSLVPYGDYFLIKYGDGNNYFVDSSYNELKFDSLNEESRTLLSDYLRYTIKQTNPDMYYKTSFMEETTSDNINVDEITYLIGDTDLIAHFNEYDLDVNIPLKYVQKFMNMNFGYPDEEYVKPKYLDSSKPYICLTFEDGPIYVGEATSSKIVDTLAKYDATATFFVPGDYLENSEALYAFLQDSISKGNEYGSNTSNQEYLVNLSSESQIKNEIYGPIYFFKNHINYEMKLFRPPGGLTNDTINKIAGIPAICWSVDSGDWLDIDVDSIVQTVLDNAYNGAIVAMHDIYSDSAIAVEQIVPKLLEKGFQLVTVSDALTIENLGYDVTCWYGY
ncbi:MAG: polysaccharide deacetylase family protein [Erysipelotrichaceae bacterium]|nr:polysaccharide deacetylase family protein [Erysipelotrichaceae bacterium]